MLIYINKCLCKSMCLRHQPNAGVGD